jgi:group I intron endonuclease
MNKTNKKIITGIYCIENLIDNKKYIGRAKNINIRWGNHRVELNGKRSNSVALQNAWSKYGENNFKFYIVIECTIRELDELEKFYIKEFHSHTSEWGYNISWGGKSPNLGKQTSEETKTKLSISNIGKNKGRKHTIEEKEKMSKNRMGIPASNKGKPMLEIQKEKLRKPKSEETKKKISKANKGKINTDETKKRKSIGGQGIKKSKNPSSKYIGVSKSGKKWRVRITVNKIFIDLKTFESEIEAAKAYNDIALKYFGKTAKLNNIEE